MNALAPSSASIRNDNGRAETPGCPPTGLQLTRKEAALLAMLKQHSGSCIPRVALLNIVWGYCDGTKTRTLDVHICRLRNKLGREGQAHIKTIFRRGYFWDPNAPD